jgi:multicopper oxidase
MSEPRDPGRNATMKNTRRFGRILALVAAVSLLAQFPAGALPAGTPKVGMVCTPGTVSGSTHTFNLVANTGYVQIPDGNHIFMWSYAVGAADDPTDLWPNFQSPGPVLCVTQGQTVVVNLHNTLSEPTSIVFPGQDAEMTATGGSAGLFTTEAPVGGDVTYTFTAASPGTYLYESGSNVSKQVEMGLYGALVVRPSTGANLAYGASTQFDPNREFMLLLAEIDPDLHQAVETGGAYDFTKLHNHYFTINGRSFPDTLQDNGSDLLAAQPYGALVRIPAHGTQPALIRMLNAGADNHPFHPHGNHTREIAQDGRLLVSPGGARASSERFGETIGSGQTKDYLLTWDDPDNWNPNSNPLPVAQPNYRNLTFKDGITWYSGSPYLGYRGTFPTGTTTLNLCGEWYFPLHSHALNEFTNFDEPFGGMATLLRVDPQGGCFGFPASTTILANGGTLRSGTYKNLGLDDSLYYRVNSTTSGTRTASWYGQFTGVPVGAKNFSVTYKGRNCGTGSGTCPATASKTTTVSIWRWTTSSWVTIAGPTLVGTTDVTFGPTAVAGSPSPTSWANYIGTGTNRGRVRVRVLTTGTGTINFVTGGNLMKLVYDAP